MQKKTDSLGGLRLLLWGAVLFLMIGVFALLLDDGARQEPVYTDAVMVWGDQR